MKPLYDRNGLIFWDEQAILLRNNFAEYFAKQIYNNLRHMNKAWRVIQIEAPLLTPKQFVNPNYGPDDMFVFGDDLILRPETTPGSYVYARHLLDDTSSGYTTPLCVWQMGKSFRREQDSPLKHMKLKEFYQQEFQCIYTSDTGMDYYASVLPVVERMIKIFVGLPTRIVESDRLPSYSKRTMDVEVNNGDKWMEVTSISLRTDFPGKYRVTTRKEVLEKDLLVVEIAIGLDRCVYNFLQR